MTRVYEPKYRIYSGVFGYSGHHANINCSSCSKRRGPRLTVYLNGGECGDACHHAE